MMPVITDSPTQAPSPSVTDLIRMASSGSARNSASPSTSAPCPRPRPAEPTQRGSGRRPSAGNEAAGVTGGAGVRGGWLTAAGAASAAGAEPASSVGANRMARQLHPAAAGGVRAQQGVSGFGDTMECTVAPGTPSRRKARR